MAFSLFFKQTKPVPPLESVHKLYLLPGNHFSLSSSHGLFLIAFTLCVIQNPFLATDIKWCPHPSLPLRAAPKFMTLTRPDIIQYLVYLSMAYLLLPTKMEALCLLLHPQGLGCSQAQDSAL